MLLLLLWLVMKTDPSAVLEFVVVPMCDKAMQSRLVVDGEEKASIPCGGCTAP